MGNSFIGLRRDEILPINGSSAGISQCDTLGVNQLLSAYQSIFDEGRGVFFANMGYVVSTLLCVLMMYIDLILAPDVL